MPRDPIVLYSTNTWLAYAIAEQYYGGNHYVWCTPHFDAASMPSINYAVPPSSSPVEIYRALRKDVKSGDRHSAKILANKGGLSTGVGAKPEVREITQEEADEILSAIAVADTRSFRPVIFVIPFDLVRNRVENVPVGQRAHPLSAEFIIRRLPRKCFDIIGSEGIENV
jgi:hypothetical protein